MANEHQDVSELSGWIMDKSSGRETTDGPSDDDKTVAERVSLVVGAQYEHDRAEGALSAGANKYDVSGEGYQDVKDAMAILKFSAEYHASQINEQDLQTAVNNGEVDEAEAAIVLTYRSDAARSQGIQMNDSYYSDLEERLEGYDSGEASFDQSKDDGQER